MIVHETKKIFVVSLSRPTEGPGFVYPTKLPMYVYRKRMKKSTPANSQAAASYYILKLIYSYFDLCALTDNFSMLL